MSGLRSALGAVALAAGCCGVAAGQEPVNAFESGTQPAPGHVILKEQFRFYSLRLDDGARIERFDAREYWLGTTVNVGLARDWSLSLRAPLRLRDADYDRRDGQTDLGIGDFTALAKYRIWRHDSGPIDSQRLALFGGIDVRTGDGPFTADAYNPLLGAAFTGIFGRHGVNAALTWKFTTDGNEVPVFSGESTADELRYDLAYLWRIAPAAYAADTEGAWYAIVEANGVYETNGDNELLLGPSLMYEARRWALELSVQAPVWRDVARRAETDVVFAVGLRFSL